MGRENAFSLPVTEKGVKKTSVVMCLQYAASNRDPLLGQRSIASHGGFSFQIDLMKI
jgi:hypothetical protein